MKAISLRPKILPVAITLCLATLPCRAADPADVTVHETPTSITLNNALLALTIDRKTGDAPFLTDLATGSPLELGDTIGRTIYWDANGAPANVPPAREIDRPKSNYFRPVLSHPTVKVLSATREMADVVVETDPAEWFPFHAAFHYLLRRGTSGIYLYATVDHGPKDPAALLGQFRCTVRAENKGKLFTDQFIDDARKTPPPISKIVSTIQDATFRLTDGSAYTKYDQSQFVHRFSAYGFAGHGTGLWFLWPSTESCNGGPLKQELTVQIDNIMQTVFQGEHFGAAPIRLADGEQWSKCFGPVLLAINHGDSPEKMWQAATDQACLEQSHWPYPWLHDDAYPLHRGSIEARISLDGLPAPHLAGTWAILAADEPGEENADWALRAKGYQCWTQLSDDGALTLHNIRPGAYTLFLSGADQFEDFQKHAITVAADQTTSLGDLHWHAVTHGKTLWQIGRADRSPSEFHDGRQQDYRNYDAFLNYFRTFPHDITFTIGESTEARDWEFAQWSWYNEHPAWTIRFTCDPRDIPPKGAATLTIGIAAAQTTTLITTLNGTTLAARRLARTGEAAYRSGAQDSRYTVESIPFDAALLKPGPNELTLTQSNMQKFSPDLLAKEKRPRSAIMFDAIRLEVQPAP